VAETVDIIFIETGNTQYSFLAISKELKRPYNFLLATAIVQTHPLITHCKHFFCTQLFQKSQVSAVGVDIIRH